MSDHGAQIAYGDAMDAFPSWETLSRDAGARVKGWEFSRGRTDETEKTGTGTGRIFVNDLDAFLGSGADLPTHARMALRGSQRFRGHVSDVYNSVHNSGIKSDATIEIEDLFAHLSEVEGVVGVWGIIPPPNGAEGYIFYENAQVDDRQRSVLTDAGVPSSLTSLYSGNVEVFESSYTGGTTAMQMLDEAVDAEWPGIANRFTDAAGRYCFRGRHARFNPSAYGTAFWEAATEGLVTAGRAQTRVLEFANPKSVIVNSALAYPQGMADDELAQMRYEDLTSQGRRGIRSWSAENLLTKRHLSNGNTGADECLLFSKYQVDNHAVPTPRIRKLGFRSLRDSDPRAAATWALMKGVEIGDVVDVFTGWISGRYFVEGITTRCEELDGTIPNVTVELDLSPAAYWTTDPF